MKPISVALLVCLSACALAQGVFVSGGSSGSGSFRNGVSSINGTGQIGDPGHGPARSPVGVGSLQTTLRIDPPSGSPPRGLTTSYRGRSSPGTSYFTRTVMDSVHHESFGYEVLLEEQQPGTYLATFGKLAATPIEAAATAGGKLDQWSIRTLALPEPKIVHDGDVIAIELMRDAATGYKLIDDVTFQPPTQRPMTGFAVQPSGLTAAVQPGGPAVPKVDGPARDFSGANVAMRLTQPRITLNGAAQSTLDRLSPNVVGSLVWLYLPGKGRYILSLVPRPELNFQKAGELRGGTITLTLGGDTITLECRNEIVSVRAPYNLYVLRDPEWEPTAQAQKGKIAIGSVDAAELPMPKLQ
jgi:hypothetical protein